jgi:hypothetical protein
MPYSLRIMLCPMLSAVFQFRLPLTPHALHLTVINVDIIPPVIYSVRKNETLKET